MKQTTSNREDSLLQTIINAFPHFSDFSLTKLALRVSYMYFCKKMLPKAFSKRSPDFHYEIADQIEDLSVKRLNVIAPRGTAKSTLISLGLPMWMLCNKRPEEGCLILIFSETKTQALNFIARIKTNLEENEMIRKYYGDLGEKTAKKWTEEQVILANGARVIAFGCGQKPRGAIENNTRPTLIIFDDVESETNANTIEARTINRRWITEAVLPTLDPEVGRLIMIGTIISEDCFLMWAKSSSVWTTLEYSAIDKDGDLLWEEKLSRAHLDLVRKEFEEMGNIGGFYQEYMNIPQAPEDAPFKSTYIRTHDYVFEIDEQGNKWLRTAKGETKDQINCRVFIGVDLASSLKAKNDYTVILVLAVGSDGNYYVIDHYHAKSNPAFHPQLIFDYARKYKCNGLAIETVAYQEACRASVRELCREHKYYIPGIDRKITQKTAKSERILSLVPVFASGRWYFRKCDMGMQAEFLSFPKGRNDDSLDGCELAYRFSSKPQKIEAVEDKTKRKMKNLLSWKYL